jgi:hypothetical protein
MHMRGDLKVIIFITIHRKKLCLARIFLDIQFRLVYYIKNANIKYNKARE